MPLRDKFKNALTLKILKLTGRRHSKESTETYTVVENYEATKPGEITVDKGQIVYKVDEFLSGASDMTPSDDTVEWWKVRVVGDVHQQAREGRIPVNVLRINQQSFDSPPSSPSSCHLDITPLQRSRAHSLGTCVQSTTHLSRRRRVIKRKSGKNSSTASSIEDEVDPEQIEAATIKRSFVIEELYETERQYVDILQIVAETVMDELEKMELPPDLAGKEKILFGNIKAIYRFHKDKFLPEMKNAKTSAQDIGSLFTKYKKHLQLYITYCENNPRSEYLITEYSDLLQELMDRTNQTLGIKDLMIRPVQRIMKYHLLLKDILKYTERCHESTATLVEAEELMKSIPKAANSMMEIGRIQGFDVNLSSHGTVLLQDTLSVAEVQISKPERKYKSRRVFLFEQVILFTETTTHPLTGHYYKYKHSIKLRNLKLMEKVFDDGLACVLSDASDSSTDFYIQFQDDNSKSEWTSAVGRLLDQQNNFLFVLEDPINYQRMETSLSISPSREFKTRKEDTTSITISSRTTTSSRSTKILSNVHGQPA